MNLYEELTRRVSPLYDGIDGTGKAVYPADTGRERYCSWHRKFEPITDFRVQDRGTSAGRLCRHCKTGEAEDRAQRKKAKEKV